MSRILFKKVGRAKFISHLDLMRTMQRAFVRAGVPIKHTEGFNPHPYMNFALPLSVGTESVCELMDFELTGQFDMDEIPRRLNESMPQGIEVVECYQGQRKFKEIKWLDIEARLFYDNQVCDIDALRDLYGAESIVIEKKTKRSTSMVDIRPLISRLEIRGVSEGEAALQARLAAQEPALSPSQLISAIGQLRPPLAPDFASFRRVGVLDGNETLFR